MAMNYEEFLKRELNIVERLSAMTTGLDERLDFLNLTMLRVETQLKGLPPIPPVKLDPLLEKLDDFLARLDNIILTLLTGVPAPPALPGLPVHWGKATGGTFTRLVHEGMLWEDGMWSGYECEIIKNTGAGQARIIDSNDENSLTPATDWTTRPDSTSVYVIRTARAVVANRSAWSHGQKDIETAGIAEQLPSLTIPQGFELAIKAKKGNTGDIYVGSTKALAEDTAERVVLDARDAMGLRVTNADLVWLDAETSGEGVEYFVEV